MSVHRWMNALLSTFSMAIWMILLWLFITIYNTAMGETYPVRVVGSSSLSHASATCVGKSKDASLFLTNKHVVCNSRELYVADGKSWLKAKDIKLDKSADIASFTIESTKFKMATLCVDYPSGKPVTVCGYSKRDRFCFKGRNTGSKVDANGRHVLPGDSGGAVLVRGKDRVYCVGVANAYGPRDRMTHYIPAKQCSLHLTQCYTYPPVVTQWCPSGRCRVYPIPVVPAAPSRYKKSYSYESNGFGPPSVEYSESLNSNKPEQLNRAPLPPEPTGVSNAQIQRAVDKWMSKNKDSLTGPAGPAGASVNIAELAAYLASNYSSDLKGERGERGEPGKDGADGADGEDGDNGVDGKPGRDGKNGNDGSPGQPGVPGPPGSPGPSGVNGRDGNPGTVNVVVIDKRTNASRTYKAVVSGSTIEVDINPAQSTKTR